MIQSWNSLYRWRHSDFHYCCLTNPLTSIKTDHRRVQRHFTEMFLRLGYVRSCPIVQSTDEIIGHLRYINRLCSRGHFPLDKGKVVSLDFTKLYPLLPSDAVVTNVSTIVALGFHRHRENRARRLNSTPSIFIKQECYPSKERAEWVDESRQIQKNLKASYSLMQIQLLSMRIRLPQTASSDKR